MKYFLLLSSGKYGNVRKTACRRVWGVRGNIRIRHHSLYRAWVVRACVSVCVTVCVVEISGCCAGVAVNVIITTCHSFQPVDLSNK